MIVLDPVNDIIMTGSDDGKVCEWDLKTMTLKKTLYRLKKVCNLIVNH